MNMEREPPPPHSNTAKARGVRTETKVSREQYVRIKAKNSRVKNVGRVSALVCASSHRPAPRRLDNGEDGGHNHARDKKVIQQLNLALSAELTRLCSIGAVGDVPELGYARLGERTKARPWRDEARGSLIERIIFSTARL